ncbi:MAG: 50S ribosomal protein L9 [Coriobacteriia bacterium]|nr:50S ribosomal protein L9 [Coriobacteriia bacterium]
MKVILLQEVKGKGGEGDVVDVARGFAVNYLFPRKMAVEATNGNVKQLEQRRHNIRMREEDRIAEAERIAEALDGTSVSITAKVGEEGRLYGSVTSTMIEDAIEQTLDVNVNRRKIDVHGHIKEVGEHEVTVQVYRDIKAQVTVNVIGEGVEPNPLLAEALAEDSVETAEPKAEAADSEEAEEAPSTEEASDETEVEQPGVTDDEATSGE